MLRKSLLHHSGELALKPLQAQSYPVFLPQLCIGRTGQLCCQLPVCHIRQHPFSFQEVRHLLLHHNPGKDWTYIQVRVCSACSLFLPIRPPKSNQATFLPYEENKSFHRRAKPELRASIKARSALSFALLEKDSLF